MLQIFLREAGAMVAGVGFGRSEARGTCEEWGGIHLREAARLLSECLEFSVALHSRLLPGVIKWDNYERDTIELL